MKGKKKISDIDSILLTYLRSISMLVIMFGHSGGFRLYKPYSEFLHAFVPIFFFISGVFSYHSFNRSTSVVNYYIKRYSRILIPYYFTCLISTCIFIVQNKKLPELNLINIIMWLQITPLENTMPFPIGQVWFIHTLSLIILISPILIKLVDNYKLVTLIVLFLLFILSTIQMIIPINRSMFLYGNNLYKPTIYSILFILGIVFTSTTYLQNNIFILSCSICSLILSITIYYLFDINPDYEFHTYSPDIYYLSGSLFLLFFLIFLKKHLVEIINRLPVVSKALYFIDKHIYSIFLLHSLAIYLVEQAIGPVDEMEKTLYYGMIKFTLVFIITIAISVPFSKITAGASRRLIRAFS